MKRIKFVAYMLTFAMLVLFATPIQALGTATATIDSISAKPGETVVVEVSIENCPLVKSIGFTPVYDNSVLDLLSGEWTIENGTLMENWSPETGDAVLAFSDEAADINGTIFKLTFKVKENISVGEVTPVSCSIVLANGTTNYQANIVNGTVSVISASSTITSADVVLESDITVNYYADIDPEHTSAQMRFTMNGVETLVDGEATGNGNEYVFAFRKVAPQCMGDNIKAELILGETVLDVKEEYSVKTYCTNTLAKSAAQLEMSEEKYAALRTLIADMLEYGAKAQVYKGYKTNALVNEGIEGKSKFVELTDTLKYTEESSRDEIKLTSVGVYFDYANSIYIKFLAPGLTEETCYIAVYNETADVEYEYALSECELLNEETGEYRLVLDPTVATGYGDKYIIELYAPRSASSSRLTSVHFVEYSISSYVYSMQNKTEVNGALTPMAELARATYNYGLSASAYNSIAN